MKNQCFLIRESGDGGGNVVSSQHIIVRRNAALGDVLSATVIADRLNQIGYETEFQSHPSAHCILRRVPSVGRITEPHGYCHVDLDGAYETNPARRGLHFNDMWFERANQSLNPYGIDLGKPFNARPRLVLSPAEHAVALAKFSNYPRPWVFICPRSNTYNVRQVPDGIWQAAAERIIGTKFWLGTHPSPPGIVDLQVRHMDNVMVWLSCADLLITVDTGPMHIAAALGVQILAINQSSSPSLHLSDQCDFEEIDIGLGCENCQLNGCPKNSWTPPCQDQNPVAISDKANRKLQLGAFGNDTSAVVCVYRPEVDMLNRCLKAVIDQVQEVVLVSDKAGVVPQGTLENSKIRRVQSRLFNSGYYRKANFGARHTHGKWLLFLNDDCILDPGAVEKMLSCMTDGVGMVSNLLYYPDRTIYYAGKIRSPGVRGWGHINHRQHNHDWKEPIEIENACGCCVLVRREAYYSVDGHDEDYFLFAGDDDFSLKIRRAGYRIMHQPHATGIHYEHQSVSKTGDIQTLLMNDNAPFDRKWRPYLDWNINRVPGNFDYIKA